MIKKNNNVIANFKMHLLVLFIDIYIHATWSAQKLNKSHTCYFKYTIIATTVGLDHYWRRENCFCRRAHKRAILLFMPVADLQGGLDGPLHGPERAGGPEMAPGWRKFVGRNSDVIVSIL
jgi:hypothetical protein